MRARLSQVLDIAFRRFFAAERRDLGLDQFRTMEIKPKCARTAAMKASVTGLDAK
jgi:hypothetical protein